MKKIYLLLTKSDTFLSKMVEVITSDMYTHISISFEKCLQPMYSSSRKNGITLFPAGPCTENFHKGYLKRHLHIPCILYSLNVSDEVYYSAKSEVENIINNADDYKFNVIGLLFCRLNIPYHRKNHYFCSQFVGEILHNNQALQLPKDTSLMRPNDYRAIPDLVCQFDGQLYELLQKRLTVTTYESEVLKLQ